jgi:dGTPase
MNLDLTTTGLAPYASHHLMSKTRQLGPDKSAENDDPRTAFQRDRDRIIHCGAFRKLQHKTQVFIYREGDYFRTRLTHSLEVAQITRAVAKQLHLDEDLAEAIALAHDLGHTPFGHAGESELNDAMKDVGGFDHNEQTIRILTMLEHYYAGFDGLNLTWEVLEGIAKHCGPLKKPRPTIKTLDAEIKLDLKTHAGPEAQVASLSDDIAYLSHDCDDGIRAGLLHPEEMYELPMAGRILKELDDRYGRLETSRLVHELTRQLISLAVTDLVQQSTENLEKLNPKSACDIRQAGFSVVAFSDAMAADLNALREFLFTSVWRHYKVNRMTSKAKRVMRQLYDLFMAETNILPKDWQVVDGIALSKLSDKDKARHVADYLASMTDRYALMEHERLFDPGPILR